MSEFDPSAFCGSCGQPIDKDPGLSVGNRKPCPHCTSSQRTIHVSIHATVSVRTKLRMQGKHDGKGKPFVDQTQGDDLHRKTGKWMKVSRIIDRNNDLYHEIVTNPETGDVVHECKELLSEHRGHGSAKTKFPKLIDP